MNARSRTTGEVTFLVDDPVLSAQAEAERAIDNYLVPACDGNEHAGKIVSRATYVRETADLLRKVRPSPGDIAILSRGVEALRGLIGSSV
jgi:hypothetical protein